MKQTAPVLFDEERSQIPTLLEDFKLSLSTGIFKTYSGNLQLSYSENIPIMFSEVTGGSKIYEFLTSQAWSTRYEHKKINRPATKIKTTDEGGGPITNPSTWTLPKLMYFYYWKRELPVVLNRDVRFINTLFNELVRGFLNTINPTLVSSEGYDVSFSTLKRAIDPLLIPLLSLKPISFSKYSAKSNLQGVKEITPKEPKEMEVIIQPITPITPTPTPSLPPFPFKGYEGLNSDEEQSHD
jgi:hypothetical protein